MQRSDTYYDIRRKIAAQSSHAVEHDIQFSDRELAFIAKIHELSEEIKRLQKQHLPKNLGS